MLPAFFPAYVTGAVTAAGGSWNASIVSEVVQWGDTTLRATGLGAYITRWTAEGGAARIALGIGVLCLYVRVCQLHPLRCARFQRTWRHQKQGGAPYSAGI